MSHKVSGEVSSISPYNDQQVDKQAPDGEELETLQRKDKAVLTAVEDVHFHVSLSTTVTEQHETQQGNIKDGNQTCRKQATGTAHKRDTMAQKTLNGDLETLETDDHKYVTFYKET